MPLAVLAIEKTRGLETVSFWSTRIQPANAAKILKELSTKFPLAADFKHLKRINKPLEGETLVVLLIPSEPQNVHRTSALKEWMASSSLSEMELTLVPRHAPLTRVQFESWKTLWPISFHASVEERDDELTCTELSNIVEWMDKLSSELTHSIAAASIVNPVTNALIVTATDSRSTKPLDHAVMRAIQAVSVHEKQSRLLSSETNYLCTGLDLYATREPCPM